jgi:hypothetical protein
MSVLGDMRRELADDVAGNPTELTTYDHVPGRVQLPAAFVMAGAPYIEQAQNFGSSTVRFQAVLLTHPSLNSETTDQLDELIQTVSGRLSAADWLIETIDQPRLIDLSGSDVLSVTINVAAVASFP